MTRLNENSPLTRTTEITENEKVHVPDNPYLEPSSSDSSSKKPLSGLSSENNKRDKNKKRRKNRRDDLSYPSLSNDSESSNDSDYKRKLHKKEKPSEKGYDQIMCTVNGKVSDGSL